MSTANDSQPTHIDIQAGIDCATPLFDAIGKLSFDGIGFTRAAYGEGEQMAHDLVAKAARDLGISEIVSVRVFDMYKSKEMPQGFHSLAFRVVYRGEDRTLTDDEVGGMHERVRALLEDRFGAQLR